MISKVDGMSANEIETRLVLIIEDDESLIESLQDMLKWNYFDVLTATNGLDGIQLAIKYKPDCVLVDLMLSQLDGFEVIITLQSNPATLHIPLIVLSGFSDKETIDRAISDGASAYLIKPFNVDTLIDAIRQFISKSESNDQNPDNR